MIIGIQKAQAGSSFNYFMFCNQPFTVDNSNLTASSQIYLNGGFYNGSIVDANLEVGMRFKHTTADYSLDVRCTGGTFKVNEGYLSYGCYPRNLRYNGKYEVYPIYRVKGTTEWKVMQYNKSWAVPTTTFSGGEENPSLGITTITALPQDVKIFDASGKRIMKLQKGLNILVYPDGKAIKVRR